MRVVVWSDAARQDYLDILRYIAQSDPVAVEEMTRVDTTSAVSRQAAPAA